MNTPLEDTPVVLPKKKEAQISHPALPAGCQVQMWNKQSYEPVDFELLLWPVREAVVKMFRAFPNTNLLFLHEKPASMYFDLSYDIEDVIVKEGLIVNIKHTVKIPGTMLPKKGEF